jgi:UDP:flavonoid glycosyltransferase YjiC (YdhE family)
VAITCASSRVLTRARIEAAGFSFATWQRTPNFSPLAGDDTEAMRKIYDNIFGPSAARAADTLDEVRKAPTDALLAHSGLPGCAIAAEAAGIPHALLSPTLSMRPLPGVPSLGSGLMLPRTPEERANVDAVSHRFVAVMNEWLPTVNDTRASQGLPSLSHILQLYDRPQRLLLAVSAAFDFPADPLPENVRYVGPLLDMFDWAKPWTAPWSREPDRPRVVISFSTAFEDEAEALQRSINAMARVEADAVATIGPALESATFRAPPNVTLLSSAPHDAVMKEVSLVVTHGGHGTVNRALLHGLPLLIIAKPIERYDNAVRVEAGGAGLTLPMAASETEIAAAVNRLIGEPQFRVAAQELGQAIAADVNAARLVGEMEDLVTASARS